MKTEVLTLIVLLFLFSGCGGADENVNRPKVYPTSGKILLDGKNIKDAVVRLYPVQKSKDIGTTIRPKARVQEDGSYAIGTFAAGDGAPEGEYIVTVSWRGDLKDFDQEDDNLRDLPELIPWEYTDPEESTLRITIKSEENKIPEISIES